MGRKAEVGEFGGMGVGEGDGGSRGVEGWREKWGSVLGVVGSVCVCVNVKRK